VDVVGLALKSGNAVILRGGSETIQTNRAIVHAIRRGMEGSEIPSGVIQFIDDPDRTLVLNLMKLYEYVDMLIPRGGAGLHKFCRENSMIPVITGGIGICHLFVDEKVDIQRSIEVIRNAKIQRPSVCNALDTVLVHTRIAEQILPVLVDELSQNGVRFKAEPRAYSIIGKSPVVEEAGEEDFDTEWLSLVLGLKVVDSLDEAIEHIRAHGTAHSDGILTDDTRNAQIFIHRVDSAAVYVNASTRFTDGAQMGLGAEIAVSTQKLHARGPMGLKELTTYKWVVQGDYHIRG
jgi:glutamate-5-semialdehyde dehydrogenase